MDVNKESLNIQTVGWVERRATLRIPAREGGTLFVPTRLVRNCLPTLRHGVTMVSLSDPSQGGSMASTVRKIDYFAMNVPNRRGEAARILDSLREQGVNLLAFTGFPDKRGAQIDFVPENTAAFKAAARRAKLVLRAKKSGFLV